MGTVTHRNARPGETLFGGGRGILIPFRPLVASPPPPIEEPVDHEADAEPTGLVDKGWYTDIGEIESTIQDCIEVEEKKLGRALSKKEHEEIVKFLTPEEQDDYEAE
ncbi:MAG: hypothetical protein NTW91_08500 [Verrucomicrobia bacterium]|nr:hypothetical protein [Verrucomicrobiota bacterium]